MIDHRMDLQKPVPRSTGCRGAEKWGWLAALLTVAAVAAQAQSEPAAVLEPESGAPAPALTELAPEELAARLPAAHAQLVQIRRALQNRRQQIEAEDEEVRGLQQEMRDLRRQLRERSQQLEAKVAGDEQWAALHRQEAELLQEFRELNARQQAMKKNPAGPDSEAKAFQE